MTAGVYPLDSTTAVGQLRAKVGDTRATVDPDLPDGQRAYAIWSDLELEATLASNDGDLLRTAGDLYAGLAASYAAQGRSIKVDTIALDTKSRGADLLEVARSFYVEARDLAASSASDIFLAVPPPHRRHGRPQLYVGAEPDWDIISGGTP